MPQIKHIFYTKRNKKGQFLKGECPPTAIKKGEQRGKKTQFKKGHNTWNKGKPYKQITREKHWNWKGGLSLEGYPVDWTETLKRSIRERDNYICRLCCQYGNEVHHIDYNKNNCNPDNLITLCKKCHLKTNHNRKYWIKYFQKLWEK